MSVRKHTLGRGLLILLLVFVVPLALAISTLVMNADEIVVRLKALAAFRMPTPPGWIAELPFVGAKVGLAWKRQRPPAWRGCWRS